MLQRFPNILVETEDYCAQEVGPSLEQRKCKAFIFFLKAALKTEIPHDGKAVVCQREVLRSGQAGSTARGHAIWPLLGLELYSS